MDLRPEWVVGLSTWATANECVSELWLFGSRAKGTARPDSDVDLALVLTLRTGKHDWSLGNYAAAGDAWQRDLEAIVGRHVSLTLFPREGEPVPDSLKEPLATAVRICPAE